MPELKLTTYMRQEDTSVVHLEIMICTKYNGLFFGKKFYETCVTDTNPDSKFPLIGSNGSVVGTPDKQHTAMVDLYKQMGYKIVELPNSDVEQQGNKWDKLLEEIINNSK